MHFRSASDGGNAHITRTRTRLQRSLDAIDLLVSRAGVRNQASGLWHHDLVADGDIAPQVRVPDFSNMYAVSALLDGRILLQPAHLFVGIVPPIAHLDVPGDLHRTSRAGAYFNVAGAGVDVQVNRPGYVERAFKGALG